MEYPTLDAHGHFRTTQSPAELGSAGPTLAMTRSLDEAAVGVCRSDPCIVWGAGCHPRIPQSQAAFDADQFNDLIGKTALVGEVGLDAGSRVPVDQQIKNFQQILEILSDRPRLVSIHSFRATGLVLKELRQRPVDVPILHWWTGTADETAEAVEMGCYFSIHSANARHSKFRTRVPLDRILIETDHSPEDAPAAIPCRIVWVEYLVAQQYRIDVETLREQAWCNLAAMVNKCGTSALMPETIRAVFKSLPPANP